MLIFGRWAVSEDSIVRPVIVADVLAADGSWLSAELLVDIGADRTVFTAAFLTTLALPHLPAPHQLGGVGGAASTVAVGTRIRFPLDGGGTVTFQGTFAPFTQPDALDMNVLGRDIMNLFAVIVDRPGEVVCMIAKPHSYTITKHL
jgi:hypothetical protein